MHEGMQGYSLGARSSRDWRGGCVAEVEIEARGGDREGGSELSCEACIVSPSVSGDSNASDARVALRLGTLRRLRLGS